MGARRMLTGAVLLLLGCSGPFGPIHGGRLAGVAMTEPVRDWSFANRYRLMQIEVRPRDPYSVNVNFIVAAGRLYVDIGDPGDLNRWRRLIRADPNVRVRFGEHIYPVRIEPVTDPTELAQVLDAYYRKQGTTTPPGCRLPDVARCVPSGATFVRIESGLRYED
jgi:hypothetical protein